ncbi:hypothetical protein [Solimonas sp. SE-A11]|uniref:hypothetical protein n=1 Tax=Solimonas sp. SE-A11 TaxID=3054954 RepID=UPI00259C8CEE|nr:hypothetical protein [Solimonas sp. SE-A11]MDM4768883.1 hypothetical protein [Solimonas sp. SE-A11]
MIRPALLLLAVLLPLAAPAQESFTGRRVEVQVYDRTDGRYLRLYHHRGRSYLAGEPGHDYEIHLQSRRGERLLAVTSVDGINVISGQTASTTQGGYVLRPWGSLQVDGWRKSLDEIARFSFTTLPDSYAARTGRPRNVGVIGIAVFEERPAPRPWDGWRGNEPLREESASASAAESRAQHAPSPSLGTGHGTREWSGAEYTAFERASDKPVEVITLWYDSHRKLASQGVIPLPRHEWAPRRPEPFPAGFVPDP